MLRKSASMFVVFLSAILGINVAAQEKNDAATDPAKADADFAVQGEYAGELAGKDEPRKFGVHVIALGGGKFHAIGYHGGLPGDGWTKEKGHEGDGETKDGITKLAGDAGAATVKNGVMSLLDGDGNEVAQLKRVTRKSPTLGAKPPTGAIVLFDGTTADHFEGGRMTEDKLLMPGVTSKQKFQSCTLHVEFILPYMPSARGQGRANSGCYLQGRYEVQILDSFGLEGKNNECGGIYSIRDPDVNMCFPPLSWQTYDIDYTAAKYDDSGKKIGNAHMTVRHNGVAIHENAELPHETTAAPVKEGPEPGPIYLQDHGNPVRFRNVWVTEKK